MLKALLNHYSKELLGYRRKPMVIQLPITARCNSRCLTCNVWKNESASDIDPERLKQVLADPYLSNVRAVGVNGGELSLYKQQQELIDAVLSLPRIKSIFIISNGVVPERLLTTLKLWQEACKAANVSLNITLSIDGIGQLHNQIRGIPVGYERTTATLERILTNKSDYCDHVRLGCTISKYNAAYLSQIDAALSKYNIPIEYHLAVPNKRIGTFDESPYSVLANEESRLLAAEFFLGKSFQTQKLFEKFTYFSTYYYLVHHGKGRLSSCSYQRRDITIDENLNLFLCATASDRIGSLTATEVGTLMRSTELKRVEKEVLECCDTCIHYAAALPTFKGLFSFLHFIIRNRFMWSIKFRMLARCQGL